MSISKAAVVLKVFDPPPSAREVIMARIPHELSALFRYPCSSGTSGVCLFDKTKTEVFDFAHGDRIRIRKGSDEGCLASIIGVRAGMLWYVVEKAEESAAFTGCRDFANIMNHYNPEKIGTCVIPECTG